MIYTAWKQSRQLADDLLLPEGLFEDIDYHFASITCAADDCRDPSVFLLLLLLSYSSRSGSVCIDPEKSASIMDFSGYPEIEETLRALIAAGDVLKKIKKLKGVGKPGEFKPVIVDGRRIYLHRYHTYETIIADEISKRLLDSPVIAINKNDAAVLNTFFPETGSLQRLAAAMTLVSPFTVITGGPGSGKTTTVVKILLILLEKSASQGKNLRIALTAPTGKAAMYLASSINRALNQLREDDPVLYKKYEVLMTSMPKNGFTIHRLLGYMPGSPFFKHDRGSTVPYDLVIVDEASMIDTALMAKLLMALEYDSKLIILGDKDQLASVQSGAVMADICDNSGIAPYTAALADAARSIDIQLPAVTDKRVNPIQDHIVYFTRSHRFSGDSGIGTLAAHIREGNADAAVRGIADKSFPDIRFIESDGDAFFDELQRLIDGSIQANEYFATSDDCAEIFTRLKKIQILTPLRRGPRGVENLNRAIESHLLDKGLIASRHRMYHRMPVLINENDYTLNLFNGENGILLAREEQLFAFFQDHGVDGAFRRFNPRQIRSFEKNYAMTVHKSQGSEYDEVVLVLPETDGPLNSREMIYTAVTRAKKKVTIIGSMAIFKKGVSRKTERSTGLNDKLWGAHTL